MEVSISDKYQAILYLFNQSYEETKRYRDMEWKILSWTISLLAGIAILSKSLPTKPEHELVIQTLLFLFTIVSAVYGCYHIHTVHVNLTWNRNLRLKCEKLLGLFEIHLDDKKPLLPKTFEFEEISYSSGLKHLLSWWGLIALTTIYTLYTVVYS
ncbi:membrane protein [Candidatus Magnetomorum sp. HK-1]|nr:membrane protein [Candidatus Magnetomorum sp. HK-1]